MDADRRSVWRPWATYGLIAAILLVWVLMTLQGRSLNATQDNPDLLLAWGAAGRPDLFVNGQYWRFFTANFLHMGIIHLAVNGYSLWVVGQAIEVLYGRWQLLYLFVVSGVLAAAGSAALGPPSVLSAGASGALFGLIGAMVWYRLSSPLGTRIAWRPLILTLVLNLGIGLSLSNYIDNWDHLSGLISGFLAAALMGVPVLVGWQLPRFHLGKRVHALLAGALLLVVGGLLAGFVPVPGPSRDLARAYVAFDAGRYSEAEAGVQSAMRRQPDDPSLHYFLAWVYLKQGKCVDANARYQQLLKLGPDDPDVARLGQAVAGCRS